MSGVVALIALVSSACAQVEGLTEIKLKRRDLRYNLAQTSRIYAENGRLITTFHGEENRTIVPLEKLPDHVWRAVVAIEDERFFEHEGVDLQAVLRAAIENVTSREVRQGGSTITQQYVKNLIISPDGVAAQTLKRKLREAALARQLERRLTKRQILNRYINAVYFGSGAYGIHAASETFFRRPATKLKPWQSATLAGLIRNPTVYDPYSNPKRVRARRNLVLAKMNELDWLGDGRFKRMIARKLKVKPPSEARYPAPYFVDYVKRLLFFHPRFKFLGKNPVQRARALFQGGLRVYTTIDLKAQRQAERAARNVLTQKRDPHASIVSIDPRNGKIKAMVGGRDFFVGRKRDPYAKLNLAVAASPNLGAAGKGKKKKLLRAPGTGRQAGSAFKPFALVRALQEGVPLYRTFDAPACKTFPHADNGGPWKVCNYGGSSYGRVSLLEATIKSINVAYAKLTMDVGAADVVKTARQMGIVTELTPVNSAVLGTNVVNPLTMASAYGTLAAGGTNYRPMAIMRIEGADGKVLYRRSPRKKRARNVVDPATAYLATRTLEMVIQQGTGTAAAIGRPAAGKTGTAQEYRDGWFVGYTPQRTTAVWVGYPAGSIAMKTSCGGLAAYQCRPTRIQVTGGSWPAQIWQRFMSSMMRDLPVRNFNAPGSGLLQIVIDNRRGCLANSATPRSAQQSIVVLQGTKLPEPCPLPAPKPKPSGGSDDRPGPGGKGNGNGNGNNGNNNGNGNGRAND